MASDNHLDLIFSPIFPLSSPQIQVDEFHRASADGDCLIIELYFSLSPQIQVDEFHRASAEGESGVEETACCGGAGPANCGTAGGSYSQRNEREREDVDGDSSVRIDNNTNFFVLLLV
jgi:hypothetical protein